MLKWLKTTFFTPNVQFSPFLENGTSDGTKRHVDLNSASIYSFCNTIYRKMPYNKISIVMDLFDLFGIPEYYILRKLDPSQLHLLQGILVYLCGLQSCQNYKFFKIEGASH